VPNTAKIPAGSSTILNVMAKLKNSYQLAQLSRQGSKGEEERPAPPERYNHLLIAKVKDTQIMFSFIVEASVIESSGKDAGMS